MINIDTKKLGLIGYPLGHSISPLIHNYSLKKMNLNYVYLPFEIKPELLAEGIEGLKALGIKGVNVTIPHKKNVISYLDELDPLAKRIGAVNTIVNKNQKLKGYNSDAYGFKNMLNRDANFYIKNKKILLIGAGGASRAVGTVLCENEVKELYIVNRTVSSAIRLQEDLNSIYDDIKITSGGLDKSYYEPLIKKIDLIVDTTPVGMEPNPEQPPVIDTENFHSELLVVDLVYNPPQTSILKKAQKSGCQTLNGLKMLLYQAAESFRIWTGKEPDIEEWYQLVKKENKN